MKILATLGLITALLTQVFGSSMVRAQYESKDAIDSMMSVHRFDTFLMLIREADLTFTLKKGGPYTIFAPTDEAMALISVDRLTALRSHKSALRRFVLAHVTYGRHTAEGSRERLFRSLAGRKIEVGYGVRFDVSNIHTTNAMVHGIDSVLVPSTY